jgi:hypothetical protein
LLGTTANTCTTCITIIDTLILHVNTKDAYYKVNTCRGNMYADVLLCVEGVRYLLGTMYHNNRHNYTACKH